jgi:hypothetical protein
MHNENIPGSEPFADEPTHNMPLRQLSRRGLTLETGLAREFGSLLSAALRSAPPKADTIRMDGHFSIDATGRRCSLYPTFALMAFRRLAREDSKRLAAVS